MIFWYSLLAIKPLLTNEVLRVNKFENLQVYDCYTPYEKECCYIENKKVNMQVAVIEGQLIAGFPIILTGY